LREGNGAEGLIEVIFCLDRMTGLASRVDLSEVLRVGEFFFGQHDRISSLKLADL